MPRFCLSSVARGRQLDAVAVFIVFWTAFSTRTPSSQDLWFVGRLQSNQGLLDFASAVTDAVSRFARRLTPSERKGASPLIPRPSPDKAIPCFVVCHTAPFEMDSFFARPACRTLEIEGPVVNVTRWWQRQRNDSITIRCIETGLCLYYYNWIKTHSVSQALRSPPVHMQHPPTSVSRHYAFFKKFLSAEEQYHHEHSEDHCANE